MSVQSGGRRVVTLVCAVLVANTLATIVHQTAQALDSDAHMDLAKLTEFGPLANLPYPYGDWVYDNCFGEFIEGTDDPDRIRSKKKWINSSHQDDAKLRAGWSFCAAARTLREGFAAQNWPAICLAIRRLGRTFHYLQDWGDPSKEVSDTRADWPFPCVLPPHRKKPRRYDDFLRQNITCMALYDPFTVGQRAAYYAPSYRGASFSQLLDWVHQSRLRNGKILQKYSGGLSSWNTDSEFYGALYESAGILLAAQNEIIRAFVDQHYRPQACDEGPDEEATDVDGVGAVTSRDVRICVVDINSVLDDHYDMYVNYRYVGHVRNPEGGTTCYPADLRSGSNIIELRLVKEMGKDTKLNISINRGEYQSQFTGSKDHSWMITAP